MPPRIAAPQTPERNAILLDEALRRVEAGITAPLDLDALRRTIESEQAKGPRSLVELMRVGRRWALRSVGRKAQKAKVRC